MKIAIIKKGIPIPSADVINTLKLAQGFYNLGHKVEILTIEEFTEKLWKIKIGDIYKFYDLSEDNHIKYFKGSLLFYLRNFKFIRGIINFLVLIPRIYNLIDPEISISKYCKDNNFDLVICRDTFRTAYNNIVNKIPTVLDLHGYENLREIGKILTVKNSKYFKGVITLNEFLKQICIKKGIPEKKIKVMDNSIDLHKYNRIISEKAKLRKKLNLPLNKKIILYSGEPHSDRGIDIILKAADLLNDNKLSFYFIGGDKEIIKNWLLYININKIKGDIHFVGLKPFKLIPYYLKAADVLLATFSLNCPTLKYMSPVKIIEYMASRTPFIATRIGRNIEICNNNECLFTEVDNAKDLSEKIMKLINNKNLQNKLIENAYNTAKEHTFKKRCKMILKL
ncbi:MAG: glycosyltransferase family 4 protein [Candidatus Hodarchaeota archaeon]